MSLGYRGVCSFKINKMIFCPTSEQSNETSFSEGILSSGVRAAKQIIQNVFNIKTATRFIVRK